MAFDLRARLSVLRGAQTAAESGPVLRQAGTAYQEGVPCFDVQIPLLQPPQTEARLSLREPPRKQGDK